MPVWATLLIVILSHSIFLVIWWMVFRKNGSLGSILDVLEKSSVKRLTVERDAERTKVETITNAYNALANKQRELVMWYGENRDRIEKEAQDAFKKLAADPTTIDRKLDDILGAGR